MMTQVPLSIPFRLLTVNTTLIFLNNFSSVCCNALNHIAFRTETALQSVITTYMMLIHFFFLDFLLLFLRLAFADSSSRNAGNSDSDRVM